MGGASMDVTKEVRFSTAIDDRGRITLAVPAKKAGAVELGILLFDGYDWHHISTSPLGINIVAGPPDAAASTVSLRIASAGQGSGSSSTRRSSHRPDTDGSDLPAGEAGDIVTITVTLKDKHGNCTQHQPSAGSRGLPQMDMVSGPRPPDGDWSRNGSQLSAQFKGAGKYVLACRLGGAEIGRVTFNILPGPPDSRESKALIISPMCTVWVETGGSFEFAVLDRYGNRCTRRTGAEELSCRLRLSPALHVTGSEQGGGQDHLCDDLAGRVGLEVDRTYFCANPSGPHQISLVLAGKPATPSELVDSGSTGLSGGGGGGSGSTSCAAIGNNDTTVLKTVPVQVSATKKDEALLADLRTHALRPAQSTIVRAKQELAELRHMTAQGCAGARASQADLLRQKKECLTKIGRCEKTLSHLKAHFGLDG